MFCLSSLYREHSFFPSFSTPQMHHPSFDCDLHLSCFQISFFSLSIQSVYLTPELSSLSFLLIALPFCALPSPSPLPQVAALQEEKSSLLAENQVLMERHNQSDSIEDINSPAGRRHLQLQTQLEQLQEETFRYNLLEIE